MDLIASPIITVLANVVADLLVSKGIIDGSSKVAVIQLINNSMASIMTLGVAIVSIHKMIDLQKHKLTLLHQGPIATETKTVTTISQPVSQPPAVDPVGQSGQQNQSPTLPISSTPVV